MFKEEKPIKKKKSQNKQFQKERRNSNCVLLRYVRFVLMYFFIYVDFIITVMFVVDAITARLLLKLISFKNWRRGGRK